MINNFQLVTLIILLLIFLLSLRDGIFKRFIQATAGFVAYGLGDRGKLSYILFRPYRPNFLTFDSTEQFKKKYPNFDFYYADELIDQFDTGDILLFESDNSKGMTIGVKWANMSPFTHIAMVYKDENGELFAFEASGNTKNVTLTPVMEKLHDTHYHVITYRKFKGKLTDRDQQIIRDHIDENLGKLHDAFASKVGFLELVIAALDFETHKLIKNKFENHRNTEGYFCSELVADLYMKLGIIPDDIGDEYPDANEYTPGDFTYFVDKITLNREKEIVRELKEDYLENEVFIMKDADGRLLSKANEG